MLEAKHDPPIIQQMNENIASREERLCDGRRDGNGELGPLDPSCGFAPNSRGTLGRLVLWLSCAQPGAGSDYLEGPI